MQYKIAGIEGYYRLYIPAKLKAKAPLVIVLHGITQNNDQFYNLGFNPIADTAGFLLCYPQGKGYTWNQSMSEGERDDLKFLNGLAKYLQAKYSLDPNRTFVTGFSQGASMAFVLSIHSTDVFKAFATVSGLMESNIWEMRDEASPSPLLHIHGTNDQLAPLEGNLGKPPVAEVISFFTQLNKCTEADTLTFTHTTTVYTQKTMNNNNQVVYYKIQGQEHAWPGAGSTVNRNFADVAGFNACKEIWSFFRKY